MWSFYWKRNKKELSENWVLPTPKNFHKFFMGGKRFEILKANNFILVTNCFKMDAQHKLEALGLVSGTILLEGDKIFTYIHIKKYLERLMLWNSVNLFKCSGQRHSFSQPKLWLRFLPVRNLPLFLTKINSKYFTAIFVWDFLWTFYR